MLLCIGNITIGKGSATLMNGYLAAWKAYAEMEQTECGTYFLLTGYEYAHLTRQYIPGNLSPVDKGEWQRGFIVGWNACPFGFEKPSSLMKLSTFARRTGICYRTAWRWWKTGKIKGYQMETGTVVITEEITEQPGQEKVVVV